MRSATTTIVHETVVVETQATEHGIVQKRSYKGMRGQWTKWGGAKKSVLQEAVSEFWYCQSCGAKQPEMLKPYVVEYPEGEYIRVCAICLANKCEILGWKLHHDFSGIAK